MATSHWDYPWWKAKNNWCSVKAQFHDGAGRMWLSLLPIEAAYTPFITGCNQSPLTLPKMQDPQLLTLCWCSFWEWGREHVAHPFAFKGGHSIISEWPQPIATQIMQDAKPKIVATLLTFILPGAYLQYVIISFGILHYQCSFGSRSIIFMYFLLHHYIVL